MPDADVRRDLIPPMNGELAQLIALAAHGSVWLQDSRGPAPELMDGNSTFQYVGNVEFDMGRTRLLRRSRVLSLVSDWFDALRLAGVTRLWLVCPLSPESPEHFEAPSFANEARSSLLAIGGKRDRLWRAHWTVPDPQAPDSTFWTVRFSQAPVADIPVRRPDLHETETALVAALREAQLFARGHEPLEDWARWFQKAIELCSARDPQPPYHPDMFPRTGFPPDARRLLAIATQSWVFGGMGSWNDVWFDGDDQGRYREVTSALYDSMLRGFEAAVNSALT